MPLDYLPDDLNRLWKEFASTPVHASPDKLRLESRKLKTRLLLRNWFVTGVCCFILAAYGFFFLRSTTALERAGSVLSVLGVANVIVQFQRRPARTIPDSAALNCLQFYRAELKRHRDLHRGKGVLSWLLPVLPGPLLFNIGFALDRPMFAPLVAFQLVVFLIIAAIVVPLNLRLARRYQRRLSALDASEP